MAIIIKTSNPEQLYKGFTNAINDYSILTWIVDGDGDFTIKRESWRNHAWMRYYKINNESVAFGIVESRNYPLAKELYGIMHGRLVATLLTHFDDIIFDIEVTSQLDIRYDVFKPVSGRKE